MNEKIVTRFAPSPTGFIHVGNVRTALYAYLWAKKNNGVFILRIEDTDKEREVAGAIELIMKSLKWLGLNWDEGPEIGGPHTPYLQSQRLEIYRKYADDLIARGYAYPDPFTEEETQRLREEAEKNKKPFLYREYRPEKFEEWDGKKPLRFKTPEVKKYSWHDLVYGDLSAGPEALDDFILIKGDGYPTYNFAHIVDDIEMGVTHVMRGQEFISSTPKFLSLYDALGMKPPTFATLPPIMGPDGKKKLSKRDGAKDVLEYGKEGYLPEALNNFLAFLGWNPGTEKEIFSMPELIKDFSLDGIGHSGSGFNEDKLNWFNREHIKRLDQNTLKKEIFNWLPDKLKNEKIIPIIKERITKFSDIKEMVANKELDFFADSPEYDKEKLIYKNTSAEKISDNLTRVIEALQEIKDWNKEIIKNELMLIADKCENRGEVLHPVRIALSGLDRSPDPFIIAEILGKDETIKRLQKAV